MEIIIPQPYHGAQDIGMSSDEENEESQSESSEQDEEIEEVEEGDMEGIEWEEISESDENEGEDEDEPQEFTVNLGAGDSANPFVEESDDEDGTSDDSAEDDQARVEEVFGGEMGDDDQIIMTNGRNHRRMQDILNIGINNGMEMQWSNDFDNDAQVLDPNEFPVRGAAFRNQADQIPHPLLMQANSQSAGITMAPLLSPDDLNDQMPGGLTPLAVFERIFSRTAGTRRDLLSGRDGIFGVARSGRPIPVSTANKDEVVPAKPYAKQIENLHSYKLALTDERWQQESKVVYGQAVSQMASRASNLILNALIPAAIEENKAAAEAAEKARLDAEAKVAEEKRIKEEKIAEEEKVAKESAETVPSDVEMTGNSSAEVTPSTDQQPAEGASRPVEPERQIVMVDGNEVDITGISFLTSGSGIDITFLEALPDDLRQEVINQHMREQNFITLDPTGALNLNPEFLDALPLEMREEVLAQERLEAEQRELVSRRAATAAAPKVPDASNAKTKSVAQKESINLIDQAGLANVLRLIFIPEPPEKTVLDRFLSNLCENSKSRSELLGLLLAVLTSEAETLVAVDRTFAHLTGKTRISNLAHLELNPSAISDVVPNLVTQRCLETLSNVATKVSSVGKFFLTEHESSLNLKTPKSAKKGKGKTPVRSMSYPVVTLLNLLEKPHFLSNPVILEQLIHLLSTVLRPLGHIAKKRFAPKEPCAGDAGPSEATLTVEQTPVKTTETPAKEKPEIKLPALPESSVKAVVNVLKDAVCSSKTFQFTLSVIQHLCSYPENLNIITRELLASAQLIADSMIVDVDLLLNTLRTLPENQVLEPTALIPFTSPSASQAKLLRILKTIDFLFSKNHGNSC